MNTISPASHIIVKGARQHNLKDVDVVLPKGKLIVFTGLSGSGKSSLAFDTIYAEGQRRYVESLSAYARQFLGIMQKPDVDQIDGLSPAISIDQKTTSHNPRSTVGTITEIYDYLRLLFARIGHPHCPNCGAEIAPQTIDQITQNILSLMEEKTTAAGQTRWMILSPVVRDKKGEFAGLFENLLQKGYQRVRVDGRVYDTNEDLLLIKTNKHSIAAILDRISIDKKALANESSREELRSRLHQTMEQALELADGLAIVAEIHDASLSFPERPTQFTDHLFSQYLACPTCNINIPEIEPRLFSFNTPHGACPTCTGLGTLLKFDPNKILATDLSLPEGAIIPLANAFSNNTWFAKKVATVLAAHDVSIRTPFKNFPETVKQLILFGDQKVYKIHGTNYHGNETSFTDTFEGVIPELNRRYAETTSDFVRSELEDFMTKETCPGCQGARLKKEALAVTVHDQNISEVTGLSTANAYTYIGELEASIKNPEDKLLSGQEKAIGKSIIKEIKSRLNFLLSVGLDYLTLSREAGTLAGGEAQRIRLASQIGTGLTGVLYVLDEPTIGLHPRDNDRLIETLKNLRDLGNTVIVVEHDKAVMMAADQLLDFGPKAGEHGGTIVAQGTPEEVMAGPSITGQYLRGSKDVTQKEVEKLSFKLYRELPSLSPNLAKTRKSTRATHMLTLVGANEHNLKNLTVNFPLGKLVVITGVSGSGKSTLMHDTLFPALKLALNQKVDALPDYQDLKGANVVDKAYMIDQSPIGRTPRSNPATYTKAFDVIRQIFATTKDAKTKGYQPGRFSFNVKGGRCEACQGDGQVKVAMQFLADVYVTCEVCKGARYNTETLNVHYQGKNIAEILDMTVDQALDFFKHHPLLQRKLATLKAVGLSYVRLGQPAPTLSGGEAQRVKLAKELSVNSPGHTVYLLDEPTTGLHFEDVKNLLVVLQGLVNQNNTVIIIEHNLDVIKNADWVIDLGPEGGEKGGHIIATGTPEDLINTPNSHTGHYLKAEVTK